MTGAELLTYTRTDILRDAATPYLWSDALILRRLSEAQEIHARRTYSIVDETTTLTTAASQAVYANAATTLFILSARVSTSSTDLCNYTRKTIPSHLLTSIGEPRIYTLDEATNKIRLYPVPDAIYTVNLRIARLPTAAITTISTPEIQARYHLDLAEYVAWRCLMDNDVDGKANKAAERHRADWEQRVSDAKRELYRMQLGSNPSVVSSWTGKRN